MRISKLIAVPVALLLVALFALLAFRVLFVNKVDNYEVGYKFDLRTGKVEHLLNADGTPKRGYIVTPPVLVKVHTVDLRPMQVCIGANARVLNCKLVQFDPEGLNLFLSWHGRDDYKGPGNSGSTSSSSSAGSATTPFSEILKSYAYEGAGKTYPFLTVLRELKPEEVER